MSNFPLIENYCGSPLWEKPYIFGNEICDCSGHGHCVNSSLDFNKLVCFCDRFWDGRSDIISAEGVQCHISTIGVDVLIVFLLVSIFATIAYSWNICRRIIYEFFTTPLKINNRENYFILAVLPAYFIMFPSQIVYCVLKLSFLGNQNRNERRLASDSLITALYLLMRFGFQLCVVGCQIGLIGFILRGETILKKEMRRFEIIVVLVALFGVFNGFLLIPILLDNGKNIELARTLFALFLASQLLAFSLLLWNVRAIRRIVYEKLSTAKTTAATEKTENQKRREDVLESVRLKLKILFDAQTKGCSVQIALYLVFLCIPSLWIAADYLIFISWLGPVVMFKNFMDSLIPSGYLGARMLNNSSLGNNVKLKSDKKINNGKSTLFVSDSGKSGNHRLLVVPPLEDLTKVTSSDDNGGDFIPHISTNVLDEELEPTLYSGDDRQHDFDDLSYEEGKI
jgi:hypothetical protein